ncbi:sterol desaturase family protein [Sediminibacterium ginsengisoli]|uniref:Fatty acid hydroxylase superfamily protein n=1 Tax=Sediminibacterium ginsengisoli TaxID=413434 RepID=A0A1T4MC04_9BACT|nr:sterol desaturase family protein [Sediminibacterium ginsengisoli]SJZ64318.1 Fatty acid hydroxylase superfamily protein [Sediminibacterium ginsengisoli]
MPETLVHYFEHIPSLHRALILAGGITFFWIIEGVIPLFRFGYSKWKHAGVNLFFTFTTIIVNFAFALLIVKASDWAIAHHFGLLQLADMPFWLYLLAGLLLLDLVGAYLVHLVEHKVKWMWKFHMVHHADMHVDTTTANRHHPGESVFRAVFTLLAVWICGAPIWLVMLYQSVSVVLSQFNHANIRLPLWLDHAISWVLISPNMHKVHHHYVRPQTDSNYGNIFSVWDRLFGTYNYTPTEQLRYGLDVLEGDGKADQVKRQLQIPFDKKIKTDY